MKNNLSVGMRVAYCGIGEQNKGCNGTVTALTKYGVTVTITLDNKRIVSGVVRHTEVWEVLEVGSPFYSKVQDAPPVDTRPAFVKNAVKVMCPDGIARYFLPVTHFGDKDLSILVNNRYIKFAATGIKLVVDTAKLPDRAFLADGTSLYYPGMRASRTGYGLVAFENLPAVWPLAYPGTVVAPKEKPAIDKRKFILWNPKHPAAPSVILEGMSQAKAVAHKMAEGNEDATFYICELVAVTKTKKVVARNVTVEVLG